MNGIDSQMKTFDFYFGASLLCTQLSHTDNLSKTLQHTTISAAEGQHLVRMTITTLQSIRTEEMFNLFWQKIVVQASCLESVKHQNVMRKEILLELHHPHHKIATGSSITKQ